MDVSANQVKTVTAVNVEAKQVKAEIGTTSEKIDMPACVEEGESLGAVVPDNNLECCPGLEAVIPEGIVGTRGTCEDVIACPIGCKCDAKTTTCPIEEDAAEVCPNSCNCKDGMVTCPIIDEEVVVCQIGCVCDGEIITCPTEEEPVVYVNVMPAVDFNATPTEDPVKFEPIRVTFEKTEEAVVFTSAIPTVTEENVYVTDSKIVMEMDDSSISTIDILPEDIIPILDVNTIEESVLVEETDQAVYQIEATKDSHLLGFIPMDMSIEAKVDAETGEVLSTDKPWWAFLARE